MVVIPGPVDFVIGDRPWRKPIVKMDRKERSRVQQSKRISRSFGDWRARK